MSKGQSERIGMSRWRRSRRRAGYFISIMFLERPSDAGGEGRAFYIENMPICKCLFNMLAPFQRAVFN